jgi:hypothetical protein
MAREYMTQKIPAEAKFGSGTGLKQKQNSVVVQV